MMNLITWSIPKLWFEFAANLRHSCISCIDTKGMNQEAVSLQPMEFTFWLLHKDRDGALCTDKKLSNKHPKYNLCTLCTWRVGSIKCELEHDQAPWVMKIKSSAQLMFHDANFVVDCLIQIWLQKFSLARKFFLIHLPYLNVQKVLLWNPVTYFHKLLPKRKV